MPDLSPAKQKILLAAAAVCTTHGASHLTLDRVAEQAALSKGGLLYHYPNKRALLEGMLVHLITSVEERRQRAADSQGKQSRPFALSILQSELDQDPAERAMAQAILAVAAEDPKLLVYAKPILQDWLTQAQQEDDLSVALVLAAEGLRFLRMLDLLPDDEKATQRVHKTLQALAEQPL